MGDVVEADAETNAVFETVAVLPDTPGGNTIVDATTAVEWLNKTKTFGLKGIYELKGESLTYCIAQPGEERPTAFEVRKGSRHTLVRLKRFKTGEAEIEKRLTDANVTIHKDEIGWITNLGFIRKPNVEELLSVASGLKKLNRVTFTDSAVSSTGLVHLSKSTALDSLSIKSESASIDGLDVLATAPRLRELSLSGNRIDDVALAGVSQLKQLRNLELQRPSASSDALKSTIESLPLLIRLDVDGANLDGDAWQAITSLKQLKTLSAAGSNIADQDLEHIGELTGLSGLLIQNTTMSDEGFARLTALSEMNFLRIDGTRITNKSLELISQSFPKLRTLYIQNLGDGVTDEGLLALGRHPGLNYIHVSKDKFSPKTLDQVRSIRDDLRVND